MKTRYLLSSLGLAVALAACSTTNPNVSASPNNERAAIDANVQGALDKLYAQVPGSREMVGKARGTLVFPNIVTAGLGVGGSYGRGALVSGGRTQGYYSATGLNAGLIAGADSKAVYVLFLSDEALQKFRASNGWTAGVDAQVSALKAGADVGIDTQTVRQPVVGYVLTNAGLMANLSVEGTKISPLPL